MIKKEWKIKANNKTKKRSIKVDNSESEESDVKNKEADKDVTHEHTENCIK